MHEKWPRPCLTMYQWHPKQYCVVHHASTQVMFLWRCRAYSNYKFICTCIKMNLHFESKCYSTLNTVHIGIHSSNLAIGCLRYSNNPIICRPTANVMSVWVPRLLCSFQKYSLYGRKFYTMGCFFFINHINNTTSDIYHSEYQSTALKILRH